MDFIVAADNTAGGPSPGARAIEPLFDLDQLDGVILPRKFAHRRSLDTIARQVQIDPDNITHHVRRIMLARALAGATALSGACYDLSKATGPKVGRRLKDSLQKALGSMCDESVNLMLNDNYQGAVPQASVISRFDDGGSEFITKSSAGVSGPQQSEATRAQTLIDNDDIDGAIDLLEQAILDDWDDVEAAELLLFLYRSRRSLDAFQKMQTAIKEKAPNAAIFNPIWEGTEQYLMLIVNAPEVTLDHDD